MSERRIRQGGLYRCCLLSVSEYIGPEVDGETVIHCNYEGDEPTAIRLAIDGVWEWDHE